MTKDQKLDKILQNQRNDKFWKKLAIGLIIFITVLISGGIFLEYTRPYTQTTMVDNTNTNSLKSEYEK